MAHRLGEPPGRATLELVAHLFQLALRAGRGGDGVGNHASLQVFGRLTDAGPGVVESFSGLGHPPAILGTLHALLERVHVAKRSQLLVSEAFELAKCFLSLAIRSGFPKRGLGLLEPFGRLILTSRQVAKPVEHLKVLTPRRRFPRLGQTLRFVPVLLLFELQLLELLLVPGGVGAGSA